MTGPSKCQPEFGHMQLTCSVCGSTSTDAVILCPVTLTGKIEYTLAECDRCRTRQVYPQPSTSELSDFYSAGYYGGDWYKQRGHGRTFARWYLPKRSGAKFLDIGCGLGYFLDGIRSVSGWEVCGTEIGDESVRHAADRLGIRVLQGEVTEIDFGDEKFDHLRISNVLEHVRDPLALLHKCRQLIRDDGTLRISVPNGPVDSQGLINFYNSEGIAPRSKDGHIFFFSSDALHLMFERSGFEIVSSATFGIRRGLRNLGKYPRRSNWKEPYRLTGSPAATETICLSREKKRPDMYYHFRRLLATAKMLPGFRGYGLDHDITLRPIVRS